MSWRYPVLGRCPGCAVRRLLWPAGAIRLCLDCLDGRAQRSLFDTEERPA